MSIDSGPARPVTEGCRKRALVAAAVLAAVALVPGCSPATGKLQAAQEQNRALARRVADLETQLRQPAVQQPAAARQDISLYFVRNTPTELWLVPETRSIALPPDLPKAALAELIKGPSTPGLIGLIPRETKVLGVTVRGYLASANFSREISRMSVGSRGEALVVAAIANTLIKLPGIEQVQILVEGRPAESLAGHVDLTRPLGRSEAVLLLEPGVTGR